MSKMNYSESTRAWLETASAEDAALALEIGIEALKRARPAAKPAQLPVTRGQIGESHVLGILQEVFGDVSDTSAQSCQGDISLMIDHQKIAIEVKNYTGPVPTSAVAKFQRDLTVNGAVGGVFISLNTPIALIKDPFFIRYEGNHVPCAYVVSNDKHNIIMAVHVVAAIIRSTAWLRESLHSASAEAIHALDSISKDVTRRTHDMQLAVCEFTGKFMKINSGLAVSSHDIDQVTNKLRPDITAPAPALNLAAITAYTRLGPETRALVDEIVGLLAPDGISPTWKVTKREVMCEAGGILFGARPEFKICSDRVSGLEYLVGAHRKKISIDNTYLYLGIDSGTMPDIRRIICPQVCP